MAATAKSRRNKTGESGTLFLLKEYHKTPGRLARILFTGKCCENNRAATEEGRQSGEETGSLPGKKRQKDTKGVSRAAERIG
jgi:hypothetical protein